MVDQFYQGNALKFSATFTDENNLPIDPTVVTFTLKKPDGTLVDYIYGTDPEVTKIATGIYNAVLTMSDVGSNYFGWNGTGSVNIYGQSVVLILKKIS